MEKNLSKPWDPHLTRTWVPTFTPAHLRTWPTLCRYPGDSEGQHGVHSCPSLARTLKCVQLMWRSPISQGQPRVPWTMAQLLAKLLSGSEDPDATALSEAAKAKSGITEPLPELALVSPSPGLSTLAQDLKRSRVSRLQPKVTCPSPFHPRARTVPIAELQDVPVTETEKKGPTALAPLAVVPPPPSGLTPGGGKSGRPIAQAHIQLE